MTEQYSGKVFKAGNSAAVRLPKDVAFALGTEITIERRGDTVTIKPAVDREAALRNNQAFAAEVRAIWADAPFREIGTREPVELPYRAGLYD